MIPRVFIASSSEGLKVVDEIRRQLTESLDEEAEICSWPDQFSLSATYMESLEKLLDTSHFAVLVLTPDDFVTSRDVETMAPRDNVVFELGLFIGAARSLAMLSRPPR